ncbi:MAG: Pyrophosphate--fructose 6-phosphate 1-phosphotransferase [Syntrophorhabdus sp. PtaB.Bin006]|nr:MAG: Pyrophosphate--fructose 6-phosphate 1-phosphotransferase [Syntrophorhabdus sp. PtaB.Bin006]
MIEAVRDFTISRIGECHVDSPMRNVRYTHDDERVLYDACLHDIKPWIDKQMDPPSMEAAGPREKIFFDPSKLACGIVTCGGICPGLNDVIRSIVLSLYHHYGVRKVYGFRFGYEGLVPRHGHVPLELAPEAVADIHEMGGTILGSSRGPQDPAEMVKTLEDLKVGILFALGGDGTLRGAQKIAKEATGRGLPISVIGIPKTIDNDISFVQTTFGFETAVAEARRATYAANTEAEAARNSIGLVKLMGRDSGFIAAYSVLVNSNVNFCLVPEVSFTLHGFLGALRQRVEQRSHAVVVVAEGAGQDLMEKTTERDASGNVKYGDIGVFLRDAIKEYFQQAGMEINLKYIDPSYTIRSMPANPHDSAFCLLLGQSAVHAGMSGRTNMVVSFWNHRFTHVPISLAVSARKKIDPEGILWSSVLASTGQPRDMCGPAR